MNFRKFTIAFIFTLFIASGLCSAQQKFIERTPDYDREVFLSQALAVAALSTNTWVTAGQNGPCTEAFVTAYNENNSTIWKTRLNNIRIGATTVFDIIPVSSGSAVIAAGLYGLGGDVIGEIGNFITRLDANGKPVWQVHYALDTFTQFSNVEVGFRSVVESPDGHIYAAAQSSGIAKVDANGGRIWEKAFNTATVLDIAATADNGLMLATRTGISKIDEDGNFLWSKSMSQSIKRIIRLNNGDFAAMSSTTIFRLDSSGTVLGSSAANKDFSTLFTNLTAIAANDDAFFITADFFLEKGSKVVASINPADFELNWKTELIDNVVLKDLTLKDSMLAVTGMEFSEADSFISWGYAGNMVYRSFIKTIDLNGNTSNPGNDAGITRVVASNNVTATKSPGDTTGLYDLTMPVEVIIKNFGTTRLDSVSVISLSWWGMNCSGATQYAHFNNLALQPGDSAKVLLGNIFSPRKKLDQPVEFRFSVNTFSPNGMMDYNATNDMHSTIVTRTVTGINEQQLISANVKIYPNPAADVIKIESEQALYGTISLLNTLGQELFSVKVTGEKTSTIQLNDIPAGIYIIKISNGNFIAFRNLVVSR